MSNQNWKSMEEHGTAWNSCLSLVKLVPQALVTTHNFSFRTFLWRKLMWYSYGYHGVVKQLAFALQGDARTRLRNATSVSDADETGGETASKQTNSSAFCRDILDLISLIS
eukprot:s1947_g10.t1